MKVLHELPPGFSARQPARRQEGEVGKPARWVYLAAGSGAPDLRADMVVPGESVQRGVPVDNQELTIAVVAVVLVLLVAALVLFLP